MFKNLINRIVAPDSYSPTALDSSKPLPLEKGESFLTVAKILNQREPLKFGNNILTMHSAIFGDSSGPKVLMAELAQQQGTRGGGWVYMDAKCDVDVRNTLWHQAKADGHFEKFQVLSIDDDSENFHTFNPLVGGTVADSLDILMIMLPEGAANDGDADFRLKIKQALTAILGALHAANQRYTFGDIACLLQSGPLLLELKTRTPANSPAWFELTAFLTDYASSEFPGEVDSGKLKDALGWAAGRLGLFSQGTAGKTFNTYTPEIDIYDTLLNKKQLYVMLPMFKMDNSAQLFGRVLLRSLQLGVFRLLTLRRHQRPDTPTLVFAEDLQRYATVENFIRLLTHSRSARVGWILGLDTSKFRQASEDFERMIIQNTYTKFAFRQREPANAPYLINVVDEILQAQTQKTQNKLNWMSVDLLQNFNSGECVCLSGSRQFHLQLIGKPTHCNIEVSLHRIPMPLPSGITGFKAKAWLAANTRSAA